jgi:uncharacterized protein YcbK (DUF882 family)
MDRADPVRRRFLAAGLCLVTGAALWRRAFAADPPGTRSLWLRNTHTGEELTAVYVNGGQQDAAVLAQLDRLLRDHRSGEVGQVAPPLFDFLYDVAARAGVEPHFEIISAFRSKSSNDYLRRTGGGGVSDKSLHMQGKAIDVRLRGVTIERLRDLALELKRGGVGYYPASRFVHLDTGRVRRWSGK